MLKDLYARWMYAWETKLTMRDQNRIVRPLEWGFDWLQPFLEDAGIAARVGRLSAAGEDEQAMIEVNQAILADSDRFFGYQRPTDFRLEERHPMLFPTNVRPETLARDAQLRSLAQQGKMPRARFLRFTLAGANARMQKTTWSTRAGIPPTPQNRPANPSRP